MNLRPFLAWLPLLAAMTPRPLAAAIDFTLHREQSTTDAVGVERTYVVDGSHKIYLGLPARWEANGTPQSLTLTPPTPPGASARLENFPAGGDGKAFTFDAPTRTRLREQAFTLLPTGVREPAFAGEEQNPVTLFGWTSYEVTHTFSFYGQLLVQSTLYLNAGQGRLLRVTVTAPRADFPKVYPPIRATLLSWFEQDVTLPDAKGTAFKGN